MGICGVGLLEFNKIFYVFALFGSECKRLLDLYGLFLAGLFYLGLYSDHKRPVGVAYRGKRALYLAAVAGKHFYGITDIFEILAAYFERRGQTGRAYFQLIVLDIAVEAFLDFACDADTLVDIHSVGAVDLDYYSVARAHFHIDQKERSALYGFVDSGGKQCFIDHIDRFINNGGDLRSPPSSIMLQIYYNYRENANDNDEGEDEDEYLAMIFNKV